MENALVSLGKCPPEVKLGILNQLAFDRTSLANLSRADKSWNGLCQESLYAHVRFDWKVGLAKRLWCLITNLFDDPARRKLVKSINLVGGSGNFVENLNVARGEETRDSNFVPSVATAHGWSQIFHATSWINSMNLPLQAQREWIESFTSGHVHGLSALLLSLCPDLTLIKLGGNFRSDNIFFPRLFSILQPGSGDTVLFTKLRTLELPQPQGPPRSWAESLTDTHRMLSLPQLEAISIFPQKPLDDAWTTLFDPIQSATLKSLSIKGLHEEDLRTVLHGIGPIRYFKWQRIAFMDERFQIRLRTFASAVRKIRDTVEDVVVMGRNEWDYAFPRLGGNLESMKHLPHLRRLQIPWVFVMGNRTDLSRKLLDVVPPSLEQLTLTTEFMRYGPPEYYVWDASLDDQEGWHWTMATIFNALEEALRTIPSDYKLRQIILPDVHGGLISDEMRLTLPTLTAAKGIQVLWMVDQGDHLWYFDYFGPVSLDWTRDADLLADIWLDSETIFTGQEAEVPFLEEPFLVTGEWPNYIAEFDSDIGGFETGLLMDELEEESSDDEWQA